MRLVDLRARDLLTVALGAAALAISCGTSGGEGAGPTRALEPTEPDPPAGAAPGEQGDAGAHETAEVGPSFHDADVNHVLGTGQSLSLGMMGTPPLSTSQPYANLMFDTGLTSTGAAPASFAPLVEQSVALDEPVETPSSGMANLVSMLARDVYGRSHDLLVSLHGVSGASYPMLMKGTEAYESGLGQVRAAKAIAEAQGRSYLVRAVTVVHGESDGWQNWNTEYDRALEEWQRDYEADIRAITGQTDPIPLFESQYSGWTAVEPTTFSVIPGAQLAAHVRSNGRIVLVGPKYFLPYAEDGLHLTNEGYLWLGEYYAKAYAKQILEGRRWEPLRPSAIERRGREVTVRMIVPAPPLVLDTEHVTDPGDYGFEVLDEGGAAAIASVAVTAPDTVTIGLTAEPAGAARLRYAWDGTPGHVSGPIEGARGNLRDSDATPSRSKHALYNWCVHFDEPIP